MVDSVTFGVESNCGGLIMTNVQTTTTATTAAYADNNNNIAKLFSVATTHADTATATAAITALPIIAESLSASLQQHLLHQQ